MRRGIDRGRRAPVRRAQASTVKPRAPATAARSGPRQCSAEDVSPPVAIGLANVVERNGRCLSSASSGRTPFTYVTMRRV